MNQQEGFEGGPFLSSISLRQLEEAPYLMDESLEEAGSPSHPPPIIPLCEPLEDPFKSYAAVEKCNDQSWGIWDQPVESLILRSDLLEPSTPYNCNTDKPNKAILAFSLGRFNSITSEPSTRKSSFNPEEPSSKCCSCKKSKCLKLYCECFAAGTFCVGCKCTNCHNQPYYETEREYALSLIQSKTPLTFQSKKLQISCNCTKSGCKKNYCECYKSGVRCGPACGCRNCKNVPALRSLELVKCSYTSPQ